MNIEKEREKLRALRDELRVQLHLANAEAKDHFDQLEQKWQRFEGRMHSLGETAAEEGKDVRDAAELLLQEIKDGYKKLRERL